MCQYVACSHGTGSLPDDAPGCARSTPHEGAPADADDDRSQDPPCWKPVTSLKELQLLYCVCWDGLCDCPAEVATDPCCDNCCCGPLVHGAKLSGALHDGGNFRTFSGGFRVGDHPPLPPSGSRGLCAKPSVSAPPPRFPPSS